MGEASKLIAAAQRRARNRRQIFDSDAARDGGVDDLAACIGSEQLTGATGIAHTRWATHGRAVMENGHPLVSNEQIALARRTLY
jgi:glutamine phosphoribosylpyrophosphate amidotransferase